MNNISKVIILLIPIPLGYKLKIFFRLPKISLCKTQSEKDIKYQRKSKRLKILITLDILLKKESIAIKTRKRLNSSFGDQCYLSFR